MAGGLNKFFNITELGNVQLNLFSTLHPRCALCCLKLEEQLSLMSDSYYLYLLISSWKLLHESLGRLVVIY